MKFLLIVVALALSCAAHAQKQKEDKKDFYTDKYDGMNVDEVLKNKRLLGGYVKCMLEQGRCTPEGKEMKAHISDSLQSGCAKCTGPQKEGARKVIGHLMKHEKESWKALTEMYDPKKLYTKKYEKQMHSL